MGGTREGLHGSVPQPAKNSGDTEISKGGPTYILHGTTMGNFEQEERVSYDFELPEQSLMSFREAHPSGLGKAFPSVLQSKYRRLELPADPRNTCPG